MNILTPGFWVFTHNTLWHILLAALITAQQYISAVVIFQDGFDYIESRAKLFFPINPVETDRAENI
jgi:hypothetical protein